MMRLKEQVIRDLDALSTSELLAVQQLLEQLKQSRLKQSRADASGKGSRAAAQRVRAALAGLPGSLSAAVNEEREERL